MRKHKRRGVIPLRKTSHEIHSKLVTQALHRLEPLVDRPLFLRLEGNLRARNWVGLLEAAGSLDAVQPGVVKHYVYQQFLALVKKYPYTTDELPGFDPELVAWKKFLATEHLCKRVNQRFRALRKSWNCYSEYFSIMSSYISRVIGVAPVMDEVYDLCDFGPGASVGVSGDFTNIGRKLSSECWSVSPLALSFSIGALWKHEQIRTYILGAEPVCFDLEKFKSIVKSRVEMVSHNKISFVPKSYKTFRSIATEPLLNGYLQKGIDQYLRRRLARVGLDLRDQQVNSLMALDGSMGGDNPYCTIDLSSASDSLSREVVKYLVPEDWYSLLDCARSHSFLYKGVKTPYHKFVSMGNGFCFPLQTIIFASVCYAVCVMNGSPIDFRVYGDDIVVRQSDALVVLELLKFLGFKSNPEKTFLTGPFRESCGTDWYCGWDVRPAYLDYRFDSNVDLFKFHNATLRSRFVMDFFHASRDSLVRLCPDEVRFLRPYHGNPDSAFTVPMDKAMHSKFVRWDRHLFAWRWLEVLSTPFRDRLPDVEPSLCNKLEYLSILRGSKSSIPLAARRKTRASVRSCSYWGADGSEPIVPFGVLPGESPVA